MNQKSKIQQQAILAAKNNNWEQAVEFNQMLVDQNPKDLGAWNRLGMAYVQLENTAKAKSSFKEVLKIDKSNNLAQKHLERLAQNQKMATPAFTRNQFIEEPGKTKTIELHRLASKDVLESLSVGTNCDLLPKNRYISVMVGSQYVGALPEDLSFRLTKLIKRGNKYSCHLRSLSNSHVTVFVKETTRSKRNQFINSFPMHRTNLLTINDVDEAFLQEQDIPLQIVNTDTDTERSLDDIDDSDES